MNINKEIHLNAGDKLGIQFPDTIVIHAMGEFIAGNEWNNHAVHYLNSIGLSAHSLIAPDGTNYRCRNDNESAYHAAGFNTNSLGLEFLVPGQHSYMSFLEAIKHNYITDEQYEAGVLQVREWIDLWPIKKIVRHSDISPERKVDPGVGFPWQQFLNDLG